MPRPGGLHRGGAWLSKDVTGASDLLCLTLSCLEEHGRELAEAVFLEPAGISESCGLFASSLVKPQASYSERSLSLSLLSSGEAFCGPTSS